MAPPHCKPGFRRCPVSKQCIRKKTMRKRKCVTGTRKCANSKCYNKNRSVRSRDYFYQTYF